MSRPWPVLRPCPGLIRVGNGGPRAVALRELVTRAMVNSTSKQALTVGSRGLLNIWRDRGLWLMMRAQPLILGLLVSLTQFAAASNELGPIYFFAVVISIWLGLNNSARNLVRDRKHYVRERLSGLHPGAYLGAKAAVYTLIGIVQIVFLLGCIRLGGSLFGLDVRLETISWFWLWAVAMLCYLCGLGMGLLTSALARTEEAAVAALPLLIMPQLLLSALTAGQVNQPWGDPNRAFKPVAAMMHGMQDLSAAGKLVDVLSLLCYSRPGPLILEAPRLEGYGGWIWVGNLCHLLILFLGTWTLVFLAFKWAEEKWPRLIGLG